MVTEEELRHLERYVALSRELIGRKQDLIDCMAWCRDIVAVKNEVEKCLSNLKEINDITKSQQPVSPPSGQRRTNAEKRQAVEAMLSNKTWAGRSDKWIASECKVSNHLVAEVRKAIGEISTKRNRTGQDGMSYPATKPPRKKVAV